MEKGKGYKEVKIRNVVEQEPEEFTMTIDNNIYCKYIEVVKG